MTATVDDITWYAPLPTLTVVSEGEGRLSSWTDGASRALASQPPEPTPVHTPSTTWDEDGLFRGS